MISLTLCVRVRVRVRVCVCVCENLFIIVKEERFMVLAQQVTN
jgi:hypothetical protein